MQVAYNATGQLQSLLCSKARHFTTGLRILYLLLHVSLCSGTGGRHLEPSALLTESLCLLGQCRSKVGHTRSGIAANFTASACDTSGL
jgi:hypothetical protein